MTRGRGQAVLASSETAAITAVTVDLDDTLYPQSSFLDGAWSRVAEVASDHGLIGSDVRAALVEVAAEGSDKGTVIDRALLLVGVHPERLRLLVPQLVEAFRAYTPLRLECYPGVVEGLRSLRSRVPVACITDGTPQVQRAKVAALGLAHAFDALVVSDEIGGRHLRKPHPAPFHAALARLGAGSASTVHVGDRPTKDVAGSARVGMRCVRVLTGEYAGVLAEPGAAPWLTVPDFAAALSALEPLLPVRVREDGGLSGR